MLGCRYREHTKKGNNNMQTFIGVCLGILICAATTISGEREYGRMMYRMGYSQALEDIRREQERKKGLDDR